MFNTKFLVLNTKFIIFTHLVAKAFVVPAIIRGLSIAGMYIQSRQHLAHERGLSIAGMYIQSRQHLCTYGPLSPYENAPIGAAEMPRLTESSILNAKFIIVDMKFSVVNTEFIVFDTRFNHKHQPKVVVSQ